MARRKHESEAVADDLTGTVEGLALDHFEREKAAYEERTGETVLFVSPVPLTRTPVAALTEAADEPAGTADADERPEPEGEGIE